MAAPLATREAVFAACEALSGEGLKPTLVHVRDRIGGGSYTTVQRHLDAWLAESNRGSSSTSPMPDLVAQAGEHAAQAIWAAASREAAKLVDAAQRERDEAIGQAQGDLQIARQEIHRLEQAVGDVEAREIKALETISMRDRDLARAQVEAAAASGLREQLSLTQQESVSLRQEAAQAASQAARLSGENDELRRQLREMTEALRGKPLAGNGEEL